MKPALMICFSRSGGTLLSRIIGTDPQIILVSEINLAVGATPDHKAKPPEQALAEQLQEWYNITLQHSSFAGTINDLVDYCQKMEKKLVFRDWVYIDFYPNQWNGDTPSYDLKTQNFLNEISDFQPFALTRNAIDVYLSMGGDLQTFSYHYLQYVKKITEKRIPVIKYEDLSRNPLETMDHLRKTIGDLSLIDPKLHHKNQNVTGDIQLGKLSRGNKDNSISQMPRKWVSWGHRQKINNCTDLKEANKLLGYSETYQDAPLERFDSMLKRKGRNKLAFTLRKIKNITKL